MIRILREPVSREELQRVADESFGDLVKAVVDVARNVMAVGGELHADEEAILLQDGSAQQDLWGINLYPSLDAEAMIEFDSLINIRPAQGNRSPTVENEATRRKIAAIVHKLIKE